MNALVKILILVLPSMSFAAGGGHGGDGVPGVVLFQAINVAILFGGIVYFTKDAVVKFFSDRASAYLAAAQKSALAREQAEQDLAEIKTKLANLEATREEVLKKARLQADEIKQQINNEAMVVSRRVRDEAELTAKLEVLRAQKELRAQLLADSAEAARIVLTKDLSTSDQHKLQKDFLNNIGV